MSKKNTEVSPCNNICTYESIEGTPRCSSCWRTYEDLDQWMYMTNEERRCRIKQIKEDRRAYESKQKNIKDMGR